MGTAPTTVLPCPNAATHGDPFRYCACGWMEDGPQFRRFHLQRDEDETGISGTGVVAEGVLFSDGYVALRWVTGKHRSTVTWNSIESVQAIHGHNGKTRIVWLDGEE